jgi:hypothetical protein
MRRSMDGDDGGGDRPGDEFEEHGHTLSAMQGRGLRRELVNRSLHVAGFDGDDDDALADGLASPGSTTPADTPQHTLTGAEAGSLSSSFYSIPPGGRGGGGPGPNFDRRTSMPQSSKHARWGGVQVEATGFNP